MHYKALITRMYFMADESIQIIIDDTESFPLFKERVYTALRAADYRANLQMRRLFEDTSLTDELDYSELQAARATSELMYPNEGIPSNIDLGGEKGAIEFAKNLPSGEVLKLFLHDIDSYENLDIAIKNIYSLIDSRLQETNSRELKTLEYLKTLPFNTKLTVVKIMDILFGRMLKETFIEQMKGQKAQDLESTVNSIREEIIEEKNASQS